MDEEERKTIYHQTVTRFFSSPLFAQTNIACLCRCIERVERFILGVILIIINTQRGKGSDGNSSRLIDYSHSSLANRANNNCSLTLEGVVIIE